jgi:type VI protein secretion system component Hcp
MISRLLPVAALALALPAFAAGEKGFLRMDGVQGVSADAQHPGWFDMPSSDLAVDATPGLECSVVADVVAKHVAPVLFAKAGDTIPEVEIELTNVKGQSYYEARLTGVLVKKVVSSTTRGLHAESLELRPASIQLRVRELEPNGQLGPGTVVTVACGGRT